MTACDLPIPVLETERLRLRAPKLSDLPRLTAFYATERSRAVGGPRTAMESYNSLASRIGHWVLRGYGLWHIQRHGDDAFLGWAGILDAPGWQEPELAWTVMDEAEGQGLAFEAARAARDHSARHLGLDGVISYIAPSNIRSRKLAERLGAQYESEGSVAGHPCHVYRHPKTKAR